MFPSESGIQQLFPDLQKWMSDMERDMDNLAPGSSSFPSVLQGFVLQTDLETLSNFQSEFVNKYTGIPPPHPLVSQTLWSTFLQSWTTRVTKRFVLDLVVHIVRSGPTSDSEGSESSGIHSGYDLQGSCSERSAEPEAFPFPEITIKTESPKENGITCSAETLSEADDKLDTGINEPAYENDVNNFGSRKKHQYRLTKKVPAAFAYHIRGVECDHCFEVFRGMQCVDDLEKHTKVRHRQFATTKLLKRLRAANTPEKVIGAGMRYCGCPTCKADLMQYGVSFK